MSESNHSANGGSRRRSMLPQRVITKTVSTTIMPALDEPDAGPVPLTRSKAPQSLKPVETQKACTTSMPSPSTIGTSRLTRETPQTQQPSQPISNTSSRTSSRTSMLARPSDRNMLKTPAKPAATKDSGKLPVVDQSSNHRRSMSQQVAQTPMLHSSTLPSRTLSLRQSSIKAPKPAFSAMQQHYSPKKKPSPLAPKEVRTPETGSEYDACQISNLQVELSQLHIMHRSAASVQSRWEQSAKDSFQDRFNDLCMRHIELKEIAHQQRTLLNQIALVEWCQGVPSAHVAEKVQQVSRNIADIRSLFEPEGKYTRVLEVFESWFDQARQIESSRDADNVATKRRDLIFIEGIGDGWKAEAMVLERELTYCLRELKAFGEIRAISSLGRILSLHKTLVTSLLQELDVIQWIENKTMVQEGKWMEQTINKLSSDVSNNI